VSEPDLERSARPGGGPEARSTRRRPGARRGTWTGRWSWWLLPFALGAWARLHGLTDQVLANDEIHELRAALTLSVGEILTTFGVSNYSLPLAALARGLAHAGLALDEISLRLPAIVSGLLFLGLAPRVVARSAGRDVGLFFGGLAAVSPMLVLYSRLARPYLPALLLSYAAIACFCSGWFAGRRGRLVAAAALTAIAVWVLPIVAPAVAAPWLVALAGVALGRPPGCRKRWRELAVAGMTGVALAGALLLPAAGSVRAGILDKVATGQLPHGPSVVQTLAGMGDARAAWAFLVAGLAGGVLAWRRWPGVVLVVSASVLSQVLALVVVRPFGLAAPSIAGRYLIVAVPPLLLGVALLAATLWRRARSRWRWPSSTVALAALLILVVAAGPLWRWLGPARALLGYGEVHGDFGRRAGGPSAEMPEGYRFLRALEPDLVAVAPATTEGWFDRLFVRWIPSLGTGVILGVDGPKWQGEPLVDLRTIRRPTPADLLASGADAVVLHLHPSRELPSTGKVTEAHLRRARHQDRLSAILAGRFRRAWGRPHFSSGEHAVWDLRRLRWSRRSAEPANPSAPAAPSRPRDGGAARKRGREDR
jgi:hypothetical protein